jgi:hypothetical protein
MRHAGLPRPFTLALITAAAVGACAHNPPPGPDPYVDGGVASIRAWMSRLPRCPPSAEKLAGEIERDVGVTAATVRGLLTLTTVPQCTQLTCPGENACCNLCAPRWVVVPEAIDGTSREIAIQKTGEPQPMAASAKDCKVRAIREQVPKPEVVVSGWLEEEAAGQQKIIRASICVVERKPATP